MTVKIITAYRSTSDSSLLTQSASICCAMTGNPAFDGPLPGAVATRAQLKRSIDRFMVACQAALSRGAAPSTERRQARDELIADLDSIARYLEQQGADDPELLLHPRATGPRRPHAASRDTNLNG